MLFKKFNSNLKKDIETDVLIIGNNLNSNITAYTFLNENINSIIIDPSQIHFKIIQDKDVEPISLQSNLRQENYNMEIFKESLGAVYDLDDLNKKLKNKIKYTRNPNVAYKSMPKADHFQIFNDLYYDYGIKLNMSKLHKQLTRYLKKKKLKVYNRVEVVFYTVDSKKQITAVTSDGYKIKCKRIINTLNDQNLYANLNPLTKNFIINHYDSNSNVLNYLISSKKLVNQYLGIEELICEKTV